MIVQLLNSFRGDDVRDIDTTTTEGRGTAAKLIADLQRAGSALFLEKTINGETYTYRVAGYDAERDRIKLVLHQNEVHPPDFEVPPTRRRGRTGPRGPYKTRQILAGSVPAAGDGRIVSVAPVSGGSEETDILEMPAGTRPELTWEQIRWGIDQLCGERGWHHGCPMPSATNQGATIIIAPRAPMHLESGGRVSFGEHVHVCRHEDVDEDAIHVTNSWVPEPVQVFAYRKRGRAKRARFPLAAERLRYELDSILTRAGACGSDAELVAMCTLLQKLNETQRDAYILSGAFPETSKRSGVTYILRRGKPTIALKLTRLPDGREHRHFLAALCLHPLAHYAGTFVGATPPSDEVIAHLMLIRANEPFLWRKAGQHPLNAPEAAI